MTPDELCRWLLESRCAGYDSYSVVSEGKLYTDHFHPTQDQYRSAYLAIFRAFNSLAGFGAPEVRFQFVVSQDLERRSTVARRRTGTGTSAKRVVCSRRSTGISAAARS